MTEKSSPAAEPAMKAARPRMSRRMRLLFFATAWAIVLMPFLFWRSTWFGRPLSDSQIEHFLRDDKKPRNIQHALVQIGERMQRGQPASRWYGEVVHLSSYPAEEVRNTDAWLMGQDTSRPEFHQALLKMLQDESQMVRSNAALSLVRFGDAAGHDHIVAMLQPAKVPAISAGRVTDVAKLGSSVRQGGMIAKIQEGNTAIEVRAPISGRLHSLAVQKGEAVGRGTELATISPSTEQVWEALRALYVIGRPEDIPAIAAYEGSNPDMPDRVRQQAVLTEKAIHQRAAR